MFAMSLQIGVSTILPDGDVDKRLTPSTFAWLPSVDFYDLKKSNMGDQLPLVRLLNLSLKKI